MRFTPKWFCAVLCFCFVAAGTLFAQSGIGVNEAGIRIQLASEGVRVDLPVENTTQQALWANISLELVNLLGVVVSQAAQPAVFPPGRKRLAIQLPRISQTPQPGAEDLAWFRLRYSISVTAPLNAAGKSTGGIISVSQAAPELFELHVAGTPFVKPGKSETLLVRAVHPVTLRPIEGVKVQASLDADSDTDNPPASNEAMTDKRGFATLHLSMPSVIDEGADQRNGHRGEGQHQGPGKRGPSHAKFRFDPNQH